MAHAALGPCGVGTEFAGQESAGPKGTIEGIVEGGVKMVEVREVV